MIRLARHPQPTDKAGEKNLYRKFILCCPSDSYLRTVLTESQEFVFANIDNDLSWPVQERARIIRDDIAQETESLRRLRTQVQEQAEKLENLKKEVAWAKAEQRDVMRQTAVFLDAIDNASSVRRELRQLQKETA